GQLQEEIRSLTVRRSEFDQTIGGERSELDRMDGSDRAARIAEEIQAVLGGLRRDVERYARVRVASRVLSSAIDRFRERSQGPILRRAGALFGRLTCGSFESLRAELGPDGRPVIAGVRPGGETVPVEGLSDGTADQLFLALRLAGLEHYLEANEAMPFVVDDILLQFDDERAAAALQALAGLSARTQVVFFTHHRHLLELASRTLDPAAVFVHNLPSAALPTLPT
ncbi:MAG TPA: chromosome segregation protein SMC, partial [Desulfobacterales bacterium]|nr:chromosome segregation protein SMC [Desulfobacterales bacterium]